MISKSILLLQHNRDSYVEPFLNYTASRNIVSNRILITEKIALGKFHNLKNSDGLVLVDQPKREKMFESTKSLIVNFFEKSKPILGLGNVSELCFRALKIDANYGQRVFGWKPVFNLSNPLTRENAQEYPNKILILGNNFFSSDVDINTYFLKILGEKFPIFVRYQSLLLLNYACCLSNKHLKQKIKTFDYIPSAFKQTPEEIQFQCDELVETQNRFTKRIWDDWYKQLL